MIDQGGLSSLAPTTAAAITPSRQQGRSRTSSIRIEFRGILILRFVAKDRSLVFREYQSYRATDPPR